MGAVSTASGYAEVFLVLGQCPVGAGEAGALFFATAGGDEQVGLDVLDGPVVVMTGAGRRGCPCGLRRRVLRGRPPNTLREHVRNPAAAGKGYADASLDALGSATGLGRGSLYGTFGTKDALFRQCLDRYASIYGAQYAPALTAHPGDPARAVEAFLDVTLSRIADPSVPVGCLIAQSAMPTAVPSRPPEAAAV